MKALISWKEVKTMAEVGEKYTCGVMTENRTWRRFTYVSRTILELGDIDTSAVKKTESADVSKTLRIFRGSHL